jgi:hypothetical protein
MFDASLQGCSPQMRPHINNPTDIKQPLDLEIHA